MDSNLTVIEYSFFGCVFDDPESRILEARQESVESDWFSEPSCALCWKAIDSLYNAKSIKDIDFITILQEANRLAAIKDSPEYGIEFTADFYDKCIHYRQGANSEERNDIHSYCSLLRDITIKRRIKKAMEDSMSRLSSSNDVLSEGSRLANSVTGIMEKSVPTKKVSITELLDDTFKVYDTAYEEISVKKNYDYVSGIPMPWRFVNKVMNGLQPGLHIVAARPSVGKTSYILQCALYWMHLGYKVAFNCLDMAANQIIRRPLANLAMIPIDRAERGELSQDEIAKLRSARPILDQWGNEGVFNILSEYDVDSLKTWCTIMRAAGKLDIVIIDYVQQLRCYGSGRKTENERLTRISATLKSIAIELKIPVIVLSQLSRDNVKDKNGPRPPTLADLRGSGSLEQDAFTVTLLYFDDAVKKEWRENVPLSLVTHSEHDVDDAAAVRPVWWDCQKNQNGGTGAAPFVVYNNMFRWYMGDRKAEHIAGAPTNIEKFSKILADWRHDEEPITSLSQRDKVVYPKHWERIIERECRRLGKPVPDKIQQQIYREIQENITQPNISLPPPTEIPRAIPQQQKPTPIAATTQYDDFGGESIEETWGKPKPNSFTQPSQEYADMEPIDEFDDGTMDEDTPF